jgi:hypothetical protein
MLKEKLPFVLINTLLLNSPLLALTHGQNDGQSNELILVGLGNLLFLQVKFANVKSPACASCLYSTMTKC